MGNQPRFVLPEPLQGALVRFGEAMRNGRIPQAELDAVVSGLAALPPDAVVRADRTIPYLAGLYRRHGANRGLVPSWFGKPSDRDLLLEAPGLEHLFLFHRDGHLRKAALERFMDGVQSPFVFAAIAYRLNDWVGPVRHAAVACAERVFPKTDPAVIAAAALFLLDRRLRWQRWGDEASVLDGALARPDVAGRIAEILCAARSGPMSKLLRHALRGPGMDRHLLRLTTGAVLPTVRAVALQALIEGRARWPVGSERRWIDKRFGMSREVPVYAEREIARPCSVETLIEQGARDRTSIVRRAAADGLVRYRTSLTNLEEIVQRLADDRSRAVRERIGFVLREQAGREDV